MKIVNFDLKITPEIGCNLAGYGPNDDAWIVHDDLMLNGLLLDDGERKGALLGFDLIGMDCCLVQRIRKGCAEVLQTGEEYVILTCTHTHSGPYTRSNYRSELLQPYCDELVEKVIAACAEAAKQEWHETDVFFYSAEAKVNINRRYRGPENVCRYLPTNRSLEPLADGITDPEVGMLFFRDPEKKIPLEILVNYAAHPLASHAIGLGSHAISADYPALVRQLIREATGSHCTFSSGAAGDMFPIDSEIGWQNLDTIAKPIAREVTRGMCESFRNPKKFKLENPKLKAKLVSFEAPPRPEFPYERRRKAFRDLPAYPLELQLLSIGDICFVGVPCELLAELGLEIKWHSPFRRAYVLYNSTDYVSYICPANALVAGGYEAKMQQVECRTGLKLVQTAVDAMFEMHGPVVVPQT